MSALDFLRYTKNYVGELVRANGDRDPKYYFGDEREWRYSLPTTHFHQYISIEEMTKHPGMAEMMQALIEDKRLLFAAKDVRYLLIAKEEERAGLESDIRALKERFAEDEMEQLISKIYIPGQIPKPS